MIRRVLILLGLALLILGGGALLAHAALERRLIFPGEATQGRPEATIPPSGDYELISLRLPDGTKIVAQFGRARTGLGWPAPESARRPTVIFFYGNGACAADMSGEFDRFRQLGVNVLLPDYPGYGMSEGHASEAGFYAAGEAAYDYLLTRPDIDRGRIALAGWSMGAAVAIEVASRRPALALITVSGFTTLPAVAHALYPWLPTALVIRSRFDNRAKIAGIACPIFIAHGTQDTLVPPAMAGQLAAAAQGAVTLYPVAAAGHNDVFEVGGAALWNALGTFLQRAMRGGAG